MCLFSLEHETRRIFNGEHVTIGRVAGHGGNIHTAAIPAPSAGTHNKKTIACVCLQTGDYLKLSDMPDAFRKQHEIPTNTIAGTFLAGQKGTTVDRIELVNTEVIQFKDLPLGTTIKCLSRSEDVLRERADARSELARAMKTRSPSSKIQAKQTRLNHAHTRTLTVAERNVETLGKVVSVAGFVIGCMFGL